MAKRAMAIVLFASIVPALQADELEPAKTHAVIVGVLEWQHGLTPYPKRHRKDQELRDLLVRRGALPGNLALLLDAEATLPHVRESVAAIARGCDADATLLVYYAGHGMPVGGSDYCFASYELDPGDPKRTGRSLRELAETLAHGL